MGASYVDEQEEQEESLLADELDAAFMDDDDAVAEVVAEHEARIHHTAAVVRDIAVCDTLSSTSSVLTSHHQHHHQHYEQPSRTRKRRRQHEGCEHRNPAKLSITIQLAHACLWTQDLATIARSCRLLRQLAEDQALWRKLFCQRWGVPSMAAAQRSSPSRVPLSWKQLYFDKDAAEMAHAVYDVSPDIRQFFQQMQAAKRAQAPAFKQVQADDTVMLDTSIADQITVWRRRNGLDGTRQQLAAIDHICSGSSCSYHQIGDVFLCERTGRAHVCDDTCRERVVDSSNGLLVCSISGRCFDRWLTEEEEAGQPQADQNEGADADDFESYNVGGRLATAYLVGWGCRNERELKRALER
eukprot:jgi/Chlat1/6307/Chrsp44S05790